MALHSDAAGAFWPDLRGAPITVVSLPRDDGEELRRRLAGGPVTVRLRGVPSSPYAYELGFLEHGRIGADLDYRARGRDLATARVALHTTGAPVGDDPGTWSHQSFFSGRGCDCATVPLLDRPAPGRERTEYVTADRDLTLARELVTTELGGFKRFASPVARGYRPRERSDESWLRAPLAPGLPNSAVDTRTASVRFDTLIRYQAATWRDSAGNWTGETAGLDVASRLFRAGDAEPLHESRFAGGSVPVPEGPGTYRLELDTDHDGSVQPLSTSTRTAWTFRSDEAGTFEDPAELPMVDLRAEDLAGGGLRLDNSARDRRRVALRLRAGHQLGAEAPPVDRVRVWVSFDDGARWSRAPVSGSRGAFTARYRHPPVARTSGYASLRLAAADGDGNAFEQTVIRAYRLRD
jgi:hypothetical protein